MSLYVQIEGLYSSEGIMPISNYLSYIHDQYGVMWSKIPTFFWISTSDWMLKLIGLLGIATSLLMILGIGPLVTALISFLAYLSFVSVGDVFMSFQWDILLLETGFLTLFLVPVQWRWRYSDPYGPPVWVIWAFRCLLFRLMFTSGLVKLVSGDMVWREFRALDMHYYTQPLPHFLSWLAHQWPGWVDKIAVLIMFVIELIVPMGIWMKTRIRHYSGVIIVIFMVMIALTGNYCFFNILTCCLCLFCIDINKVPWLKKIGQDKRISDEPNRNVAIAKSIIAILIISIGIHLELSRFLAIDLPARQAIRSTVSPFRIINTYGLFATMTTQREEIEVWGSLDGEKWLPYEFRWKPNDEKDIPKWVWPHQPRLDWQLWFVALRPYRKNSWIHRLAETLFEQSEPVENLFSSVPFPDAGPNYIVFMKRHYRFSTWKDIKQGQWWITGEPEQFSPIFKRPIP